MTFSSRHGGDQCISCKRIFRRSCVAIECFETLSLSLARTSSLEPIENSFLKSAGPPLTETNQRQQEFPHETLTTYVNL